MQADIHLGYSRPWDAKKGRELVAAIFIKHQTRSEDSGPFLARTFSLIAFAFGIV